MKNACRVLSILFALLFAVPTFASAESIDLSGMSYVELVALKERINLAMWLSDEWQEVTVPQGVWEVGVDIPAGHWTITTDARHATVCVGTVLDATGQNIDNYKTQFMYYEAIYSPYSYTFDAASDRTEIDLDLKTGTYVVIDFGSVIFTPYTGKPDLGFK